MTKYKAFGNLLDAFFLSMDAYDNGNEIPIEFMGMVEKYLNDGTVDLEEKDVKAVRAFSLIVPTLNEAMNESGLFETVSNEGKSKEGA